jgi:hypothetical protein
MDLLNRSLLNTAGLPVNENWQSVIATGATAMRRYNTDIYVCGSSLGFLQLWKLNEFGEQIWGHRETVMGGFGNLNIIATGIAVNSTGVYVIGTSEFFPSFLFKYDHDGNFLFAQTIIYESFATRLTCIEATETAIYIAGFRDTRAFAAKLNNSGSIIWQKRYTLSTADFIYGMSLDVNNSNFIYFCGQMFSSGLSRTNATILAVNESTGIISTAEQCTFAGNARFNSIHMETTTSGLIGSVCGSDEVSGKRSGIRTTYLGTSAYRIQHPTDNVDFVSTKHTRNIVGFGITSPSPVIVWSRGTTNSFLTVGKFNSPFVNPFFKGKRFSSQHVPVACEIDVSRAEIFSLHRTTSAGSLVMKTDIESMLWDDVPSTWGPTTVDNFEEQPGFPIAHGALGVSVTTTDITLTIGPASVSSRIFLAPAQNYNYSNKAL